MTDHVYKQIEITGSSAIGTDDAIRRAIAKASDSVQNINWFEVTDTRGHVENGEVSHWQVTVKIGFRLND